MLLLKSSILKKASLTKIKIVISSFFKVLANVVLATDVVGWLVSIGRPADFALSDNGLSLLVDILADNLSRDDDSLPVVDFSLRQDLIPGLGSGLLSFSNGYIITWMLQQIFMFSNKVKLEERIIVYIPPIHPLYTIPSRST